MKPRLYYDNYRRAYYLQWDADSDHIGRQEPVFDRTREYIESLEAENAKLRESFEFANNECEKEALEFLSMHDENAQLRKLCADLYDHAAFSIGYFGDTYGILPRMRELGMEVDG